MARILLYSILGFFIFGIIGIVVGTAVYSQNNEQAVTEMAGVIALIGVLASGYFAWWMDSRGEAKLENVQNKPKMIYGIIGAVVGMWVGLETAQILNPTNSHPGFDLLDIAVSIVVFAWACFHIARWLNLPGSIEQNKP